jgi:ABC-type tungstate transport system substrate-binding protein
MWIGIAILVWCLLGFVGWFNMVLSVQEVTVMSVIFILPLIMALGPIGLVLSADRFGDEVIFSWKGKRR